MVTTISKTTTTLNGNILTTRTNIPHRSTYVSKYQSRDIIRTITCVNILNFCPDFVYLKEQNRSITTLNYNRINENIIMINSSVIDRCLVLGEVTEQEGKILGRNLDKKVENLEITRKSKGFENIIKYRRKEISVKCDLNISQDMFKQAYKLQSLVKLLMPATNLKELSRNKFLKGSTALPNLKKVSYIHITKYFHYSGDDEYIKIIGFMRNKESRNSNNLMNLLNVSWPGNVFVEIAVIKTSAKLIQFIPHQADKSKCDLFNQFYLTSSQYLWYLDKATEMHNFGHFDYKTIPSLQ